jgi:hypothetical protein
MPSALFRVAWFHSNFGWLWLVVVCWFCAGSFGWGQLVDFLGLGLVRPAGFLCAFGGVWLLGTRDDVDEF